MRIPAPEAVPEAIPLDIPYGTPIHMDTAHKAIMRTRLDAVTQH